MKWDNNGPIVGAKPPLLQRLIGSFSLMRGLKGFGIGLLISPVLILLKSFNAEDFHWDGVPVMMLIVAVACGLWGLFSKKDIPL